jgi:hypothetical protein
MPVEKPSGCLSKTGVIPMETMSVDVVVDNNVAKVTLV